MCLGNDVACRSISPESLRRATASVYRISHQIYTVYMLSTVLGYIRRREVMITNTIVFNMEGHMGITCFCIHNSSNTNQSYPVSIFYEGRCLRLKGGE